MIHLTEFMPTSRLDFIDNIDFKKLRLGNSYHTLEEVSMICDESYEHLVREILTR